MLKVGQIVDGKYRVERLLGQGGMGAVFEGYHLLVERRVAIKVLLPQVTASPEGAMRFDREIRAAGRIGNEHILEVFDVGTLPDGGRYMVSEFLAGETLAARVGRGPLPPRETAELMLQLLDGLAAAHAAGIVHRDLKPDNIFLLERKSGHGDFVKIIDFGVSKYNAEGEQSLSMTSTGALVGTPHYLSPEQARGDRDIDARSDLFTVGVIMYQAVAGQVPIRANTFNELLFKIALQPAPKLSEEVPGVDPAFSALVEKSMAREREARFQSATELAHALEGWLRGIPERSQGSVAPTKPWRGDATVKSPSFTTSSNFGRTDSERTPLRTGRRSRWLILAAIGAGVVVVAGLVVALTPRRGPEPSSSAVASSPPSSQVTASEVVVSRAVPEPEPVVAPIPAPVVEKKPPPTVAPPAPAASVAPTATVEPEVQPRAEETPPAPVQRSQPTPVPSPVRRERHDFGY